MKQKFLLKTMLLLCALIVGSTSLWGQSSTITFDFEDNSAHRTSGNNSYTGTNSYAENGVNISLTYADAVTTGTPINGSANVLGRIAKNTTNSPVVVIGPIDISGKTVTGISYKCKGVTTMALDFYYSLDGTSYTKLASLCDSKLPTSVETKSVTDKSYMGDEFYLKFIVSAGSSTTSNRDFQLDDIVVTYQESAPSGTTASPTINGAETFFTTRTVSIENASTAEGATIYYTTDGTDPTTSSTVYAEPFVVSASTTVKAIAKHADDDNASSVVSKTFTKETYLANLAALVTNTNTTSQDYYVDMTGVQISYVNGNVSFMQNANTGCYGYKVGAAVNTLYNGIFKVSYQLFNQMPEITAIAIIDGEGTTSVAENAVAATAITVNTLSSSNFTSYLGKKLELSNLLLEDASKLNDDVAFSTTWQLLTAGKVYSSIVGYPFNNNGTLQFRVTEATEKQLLENTITVTGDGETGTAFTIDLENGDTELALSATAANGAAVTLDIDDTNTTLVEDDDFTFENGTITVSCTNGGYIYINATAAGDLDYAAGSAQIIVTVEGQKTDPTIVVNETETVEYGSTFTVDDDFIEGGPITVTSSNTNVATVSGLVITPVAVGKTTITVSTAATATYRAGSETFELTVTAPAGQTKAPTDETITLDFSTNKNWQLPTESTTGTHSYSDGTYTITLYAPDNGYKFFTYNQVSSLLLGKKDATLTLPAFSSNVIKIEVIGTDNASTNVKQNIYVGDTPVSTETTSGRGTHEYVISNNYQASGNIYTLRVTNANNTQIHQMKIYQSIPVISVKLNASGYATYCSKYPLDFSNATDYSAWQITAANSTTGVITFSQITGSVPGGTGILLKGPAGETITLTSADSDEVLSSNKLVGTLAPLYMNAGEYYGLKGNTFVKGTAGTVPAGKALLPALEVGSAPSLTFVFEDGETTGIQNVNANLNDNQWYDLSGRRIENPSKGVYIMNGKKVVIK